MKFLISTIFLSLGVCLISCNDEITSADESGLKNTNKTSPSIPPQDPYFVSSNPITPPPPNPMPPLFSTDPSNEDQDQPSFSIPTDLKPEDLSQRIKDISEKIERLEKESEFHHNEFYQMVGVQKGILNEVKRKKTVMKSKPYGSADQLKAQKEFEDQKKLGKERLKILKEKNLFLSQLTKSITEAKNEQLALQKIQKDLQKNNKSTNKNENTDKTTTQDKKN
ncbi:hypothetical protein [Blattabacterium cuenoti]|uniref:hypothetical protein n=1 Tax=Blattabacterium cuenoti TaxID=1653831 RepID=UPI001EEE447C|nr:hypothetical protein [Blattabacterium cuenoti]